MFPRTIQGCVNIFNATVVLFCKHFKSINSTFVNATNSLDIFWRQFLRNSKVISSLFFKHVVSIIFFSSKKKVFRINASSVIAFVKNPFSFWDRSVMNDPANSVCLDRLFCSELKMGARTPGTFPDPTSRSFVHMSEKSFGKCNVHIETIIAGGY